MKEKSFNSSILISAFIVHSIVYSQSGWIQQVSNTTQNLNSIYCLNAYTAWVCGGAGTILKTTNGGADWLQQNSTYGHNLTDIFFLDSQTGWACGGFLNFPNNGQFNVLKTSNGGMNWAVVSNFVTASSPFIEAFNSIRFANALTGIITVSTTYGLLGGGYMLKSTNGGLNWVQTAPSHTNRESAFLSASNGFLISQYWDDMTRDTGYFYSTTDVGSSWNLVSKYSAVHYQQFSFINSSTGWIVGLQRNGTTYNGAVFKTTNGGLNWNYAIVINNSFALKSISFKSQDTGYVCGPGIYKSINGGLNWIQQSIPSSTSKNKINMINSSTGWCVGSQGVILKTITGGINRIKKTSDVIPGRFSLSQNYPNPFNPATRIKFDIPAAGDNSVSVELCVYDLLGRQITRLADEKLSPGYYETEWDASNFSSGVYFYTLQSGKFTDTKKMVLLK